MVMESLGTSVTQCDEANKRLGFNDCCKNPTPLWCDRGGMPEFDKYGFTFKTTHNAALSWDQIKDQIFCKKKPFTFSWKWNGGGGHMMIIKGYFLQPGSYPHVIVYDPWPPNVGDIAILTYQEYVISPTSYSHLDDYYDVSK
jgi:hypothetical protein